MRLTDGPKSLTVWPIAVSIVVMALAGAGCSQDPLPTSAPREQTQPLATAAAAPNSAEMDLFREGAILFSNVCTSCHGSGGNGFGSRKGPSLKRPELTYGNSPEAIITSIRDGRPGGMPSYGHVFDQRKLEALSTYILSLKK